MMAHRLCKLEIIFLSALTFLVGVSLSYFTTYYIGYSRNACRDTRTYAIVDINGDGTALGLSRLVKEKGRGKGNSRLSPEREENNEHAVIQDSKETTISPTMKPFTPSISYTPSLTKMDDNSTTNTSTSNTSLPTVFAITPTYARRTQRVDLTSLCHTLMHVPEIIWIVVEDSDNKTALVTNLLKMCKPVSIVHMNIKVPPPPPASDSGKNKKGTRARGVAQRNAGLSWIRKYCEMVKCRGVVYFMDDDNKYDLQLFDEIRKTKVASVFPVGFAGGLMFEGPICENGRAKSWHVSFAPDRSIPVDMAGFAVNVDEILRKPNAVVGKDKDGKIVRRLEPNFLDQFTTRETAECLGGKHVMAWHVKTMIGTENEKKNPSDNGYIV